MANPALSRLKRIQEFLDESDLAGRDQTTVPKFQRFAHFWYLVAKSFSRNRGPVRAASLAYTTLLALVPILAVVVSISSSFLKKDGQKPIDLLIQRLITTVAPQLGLSPNGDAAEADRQRQEVVAKIMGFVENIQSGTLGITAAIALIFVGISLLATIEGTFNDMWGITRGRAWSDRVIQYWATISLGPIFIVSGFALTTGSQFAGSRAWLDHIPVLHSTVLYVLPFLVWCIALTLLYFLMPNTKVTWKAALVGGAIGGSLLQMNNLFNVIYMSRVISYSKIYGSLGALPIFLVGLYFSWMIVLFGAQISYAFQNRGAYLQEKQADSVNHRCREFVALRLMTYIAQQFQRGHQPASRLEMSEAVGVPSQLACQVLGPLVSAKLLVEVAGDETRYTPARPLGSITVEDVLGAIRIGQGQELATKDDPARLSVRKAFDGVILAEMQQGRRTTLKDLAHMANAAPPTEPVS